MDFNDYSEQMKNTLTQYHTNIEEDIIPKLIDSFLKMYTGITELQGKLKARNLIKDDPYMKTTEFSEIIIPESEPYIESDESWKSNERFNHFIAVLSYIVHNYNLSLENLNFEEIEKLKKFVDYYQWKGVMNPTVTEVNTRVLGDKIISLRNSTDDRLVINTIDRCIENIEKGYEGVINSLKLLFLYVKESYKMFIRGDLIPIIYKEGEEYSQIDYLKKIKSQIDTTYSYLHFHKKYIIEVLDEEFSKDGPKLKAEVLKKFNSVKAVKKKKKVEEVDKKDEILLSLLLELGKTRKHLGLAIEKINENHINLTNKSGSIISRILKAISAALFNVPPKTFYKLTIITNAKGEKKSINLHFEKFYEEVKHMEYLLIPFSEEDRVKAYIESQGAGISKELDKLLHQIKKEVKNLIALDEFLKIQLKSKKLKVRGIKPELTVIKSQLNSTTKIYKEFLSTV